jgi:hypothetical protein
MKDNRKLSEASLPVWTAVEVLVAGPVLLAGVRAEPVAARAGTGVEVEDAPAAAVQDGIAVGAEDAPLGVQAGIVVGVEDVPVAAAVQDGIAVGVEDVPAAAAVRVVTAVAVEDAPGAVSPAACSAAVRDGCRVGQA